MLSRRTMCRPSRPYGISIQHWPSVSLGVCSPYHRTMHTVQSVTATRVPYESNAARQHYRRLLYCAADIRKHEMTLCYRDVPCADLHAHTVYRSSTGRLCLWESARPIIAQCTQCSQSLRPEYRTRAMLLDNTTDASCIALLTFASTK